MKIEANQKVWLVVDPLVDEVDGEMQVSSELQDILIETRMFNLYPGEHGSRNPTVFTIKEEAVAEAEARLEKTRARVAK